MWTTRPLIKRKWRNPLPNKSESERDNSIRIDRLNHFRSPYHQHHHGHSSFRIIYVTVLAAWVACHEANSVDCPQPETIPGCPCYNFEDGLFLECAGATEESLRIALTGVLTVAGTEGIVDNLYICNVFQ